MIFSNELANPLDIKLLELQNCYFSISTRSTTSKLDKKMLSINERRLYCTITTILVDYRYTKV